MKNINYSAFAVCGNLGTVSFSENSKIEIIGESAFYFCQALKSIKIPDSVKVIESNAFIACNKLETVTFGKNSELDEIKNNAFDTCDLLKTITLPKNVSKIGKNVFNSCSSIETIGFLGTISEWGKIEKDSNWYGDISITEVMCSDGQASIK